MAILTPILDSQKRVFKKAAKEPYTSFARIPVAAKIDALLECSSHAIV